MKKLLAVFLVLLLAFSLVACDFSGVEDEISDKLQNNSLTSNKTSSSKTEDIAEGLLDPDFKAAMDSYEEFFDEYIVFMNKYKDNPTDMGLLKDYATYMEKYTKAMEDFEKWENEDLNAAETAYYLEVQTRVSKKLMEAA